MTARALALATAALAASAYGAAPLTVTAVRFWPVNGATRIAIEVTGDFRYYMERLETPDRVFFDVFGAQLRLDHKSAAVLNVSHRLVRRVRVAETQPGTTRVVLDLARGAEVTASKLSNPDRLIVEVRAPGEKAPAPPPDPGGKRLAGVRVSEIRGPAYERPPARAFVPPAPVPPPPLELWLGPLLRPERPTIGLPLAVYTAVRMVPGPPPLRGRRSAEIAAEPPPRVPPPVASLPQDRASSRPQAAVETPVPARPTNSAGERSLTRALGLKLNRIVLDPGHGGRDQGTAGPNGLLEKDLVLDVARRLGALIEKRLGAEVVYTRDDDRFVPLEARTTLANERQADLFLSLHANASSYRSVAGIETFYLNFTDSRDSLEVAARENASAEKSIHELRDLIQKITLYDKAEESREFAKCIQASLYTFAARSNPEVRDRGVRKAPFVVLIGAMMPSVLVEIGFISHQREETLLKRPEHRQKLAEALCQGLERYAGGLSHFRVARGDRDTERAAAKNSNE